MLEIQGISKKFGKQNVLDNVNIHIDKGTIHGLIGENGAGKTTLIQMILGIYGVEEGQILIEGESIQQDNTLKQYIGYVADSNQFFRGYRIKELIEFYKDVYKKFDVDKFNRYNQVFELDLSKKIKQLSKGMQMRLAMMLSLSTNPKIMLLDEPTSGLDVIAKKQILEFIIQEVEENELTVLISSHHLGELEKICDDITMLHKGKVTYQSSVEKLKNEVKKFQVIFQESAPTNLATWDEIICVEQIGSVYYVITKKQSPDLVDKLKNNGARIVEQIGLTLEEIFIYTNQAK